MTIELYREDAYLRECEATVVAIDAKGIRLDRTIFYPHSGGQAGDAGTLSSITIVDTIKGEAPGEVVHVPAPGQDLANAIGAKVVARIDWERRHRHMRFHTATHLLCAIVPHQTNGCSITGDYARLDFDMVEPLDKAQLESGLARLVAEAHDVRTLWVTDEELESKPELVRTMSVAPPKGFGRVRLLEIEGVDLQACGGTHVANTREIGAVVVTRIERKAPEAAAS